MQDGKNLHSSAMAMSYLVAVKDRLIYSLYSNHLMLTVLNVSRCPCISADIQ